jgi:hypothetical protein
MPEHGPEQHEKLQSHQGKPGGRAGLRRRLCRLFGRVGDGAHPVRVLHALCLFVRRVERELGRVGCHVINAAAHFAKRNLGLKARNRIIGLCRCAFNSGNRCDRQNENSMRHPTTAISP